MKTPTKPPPPPPQTRQRDEDESALRLARIEAAHAALRSHVRALFIAVVALLIVVAVQRAGLAELRGRIDGLLIGLGGK